MGKLTEWRPHCQYAVLAVCLYRKHLCHIGLYPMTPFCLHKELPTGLSSLHHHQKASSGRKLNRIMKYLNTTHCNQSNSFLKSGGFRLKALSFAEDLNVFNYFPNWSHLPQCFIYFFASPWLTTSHKGFSAHLGCSIHVMQSQWESYIWQVSNPNGCICTWLLAEDHFIWRRKLYRFCGGKLVRLVFQISLPEYAVFCHQIWLRGEQWVQSHPWHVLMCFGSVFKTFSAVHLEMCLIVSIISNPLR